MSFVIIYPRIWPLTIIPHKLLIFSVATENPEVFSVTLGAVFLLPNHRTCTQILENIHRRPGVTLIASECIPIAHSGNPPRHRLQLMFSATLDSTHTS